ncbi:MAG: ABC transporter ATP-binding protein [Acidimicrobiia bacterium]|nr:MAG: ABC transporter ATP-binding protein [Acidimicrobiia bacterium]
MTAVLEVAGLRAGYSGVEVLHGIDLRVDAGEVVALLGANGAGKTTTLHAVCGLVTRTGGDVRVLGATVPRGRASATVWRTARRGLALVSEDRALFSQLTVGENLTLGPRRRDRRAVEEALGLFPVLRDLLGRRAGLCSGGEQQMLAIARALAGRPRLLLVDECSLGLAPIVVGQLLPAIRRIADTGTAVVLVEQHVPAALAVADRAYVLSRGAVAYDGDAGTLAARPDVLEEAYLGRA